MKLASSAIFSMYMQIYTNIDEYLQYIIPMTAEISRWILWSWSVTGNGFAEAGSFYWEKTIKTDSGLTELNSYFTQISQLANDEYWLILLNVRGFS